MLKIIIKNNALVVTTTINLWNARFLRIMHSLFHIAFYICRYIHIYIYMFCVWFCIWPHCPFCFLQCRWDYIAHSILGLSSFFENNTSGIHPSHYVLQSLCPLIAKQHIPLYKCIPMLARVWVVATPLLMKNWVPTNICV